MEPMLPSRFDALPRSEGTVEAPPKDVIQQPASSSTRLSLDKQPSGPKITPSNASDDLLEAHFTRLLGRTPTSKEIQEFCRIRDALDLDHNDALWLILLSLQYMRGEFEQSIDQRLTHAKKTADALIASAKADFLKKFPAELTKTAEQVTIKATGYTGPVVITGLIVGLALLIVGFGGVGWLAYELGERSGYERGMLAARSDVTPAPKSPVPPTRGR